MMLEMSIGEAERKLELFKKYFPLYYDKVLHGKAIGEPTSCNLVPGGFDSHPVLQDKEK